MVIAESDAVPQAGECARARANIAERVDQKVDAEPSSIDRSCDAY